ncbi:sugar kinase [Loktanella sp. DJP18]|uniref:sugar kinase n=1 Tax=Loktanella sp. DJP18 TaxID=3409788 RepID=UPI003BB74C8B
MTRILSIGECMVEMAPTAAPGEFRMGFAGDTMNTAWYLRRLLPATDSVDYLTAVGTDGISEQMIAFLTDAGLGIAHVQRRSDRTVGLYMIQLAAGERSFSYWRGQSAARTLAQDDIALERALSQADIAYVSGITLAILPEDDRARLMTALAAHRAGGRQVVFDPNLRPHLWQDTDVMTAAVMQAARISDIVLPSHDDEVTWFGDADVAATARRYADAGATCVVVKNGPGPMLSLEDGKSQEHAPAKVDRVVDTTAAGDSFNAGYLAARIAGADQATAITRASELAARVIGARGALVPIT